MPADVEAMRSACAADFCIKNDTNLDFLPARGRGEKALILEGMTSLAPACLYQKKFGI
jgi:hypothetical protein